MPRGADIAPPQQTPASSVAGKPQSHHARAVVPSLAPMQAEPDRLRLAEAGERGMRTPQPGPGGRHTMAHIGQLLREAFSILCILLLVAVLSLFIGNWAAQP